MVEIVRIFKCGTREGTQKCREVAIYLSYKNINAPTIKLQFCPWEKSTKLLLRCDRRLCSLGLSFEEDKCQYGFCVYDMLCKMCFPNHFTQILDDSSITIRAWP